MSIKSIDTRLRAVYAADTAQPHDGIWTKENAAKGHCCVTAMIVQDHFGGKIMRCLVDDPTPVVHYLNELPNKINIDLTWDQFSDNCVTYSIRPAFEEEYLFNDTLVKYALLKERAGL